MVIHVPVDTLAICALVANLFNVIRDERCQIHDVLRKVALHGRSIYREALRIISGFQLRKIASESARIFRRLTPTK